MRRNPSGVFPFHLVISDWRIFRIFSVDHDRPALQRGIISAWVNPLISAHLYAPAINMRMRATSLSLIAEEFQDIKVSKNTDAFSGSICVKLFKKTFFLTAQKKGA